uniref:Uncharacterized protein n=1 Tax=Anguilla anguilla TaxID=7936 RepID=A0A0E9XVX0_ANGAN
MYICVCAYVCMCVCISMNVYVCLCIYTQVTKSVSSSLFLGNCKCKVIFATPGAVNLTPSPKNCGNCHVTGARTQARSGNKHENVDTNKTLLTKTEQTKSHKGHIN